MAFRITLLLLPLTGCATAPTVADLLPFGRENEAARVQTGPVGRNQQNDVASGWDAMVPPEGSPILYGRDGTPVTAAPTGKVTQEAGALNAGVDGTGGSRAVLLDLYSELREEHSILLEEFEAVSKDSEMSSAKVVEQSAMIKTLEARVAALTQRNQELENSQLELAGRLAQAQIGRLEAERAFLEASLEWRRMNAANTRSSSSETQR